MDRPPSQYSTGVYNFDYVDTLVLGGDQVYVGGSFTEVNGTVARGNAAAFDAATGAATTWNPQADNVVDALLFRWGSVYMGGNFDTVNGGQTARAGAAAFDSISGTASAWNPQLSSQAQVNCLASDATSIYMGGQFTSADNGIVRNNFAAVDPVSGTVTAFDPEPDSSVSAVDVKDGIASLGGDFYQVGNWTANAGQDSPNFAQFDIASGDLVGPDTTPDQPVLAIAQDSGDLFLGGYFDTVAGQEDQGFADFRISCLSVPTPTPTETFTATPSQTYTYTSTETPSPTASPTETYSASPTETSTDTFTASPTETYSVSPTETSTETYTASPTETYSVSPTETSTATYTASPTETYSASPTETSTDTFTASPTETYSASPTETSTDTFTASLTETYSASPTEISTNTFTASPTVTNSVSPTETSTNTFTASPTATYSVSSTSTDTPTYTRTDTATTTASPTKTETPTYTRTGTPTNTASPTKTDTATDTRTDSPTYTRTNSPTVTKTNTPSPTATYTPSGLPCLSDAVIANAGTIDNDSGTLVNSYISTNGTYGGSNVLSNGAEEASGQIVVNSPSVVDGTLYPNSTPGLTPVAVPSDAISEPDLSLYGTLTIPKGDYVYNNIVLGNGAQLIPSGGQVRIWFNSLNINGSAVAGATSSPELLGFFSRTTSAAITIDGSSGDFPSIYGVLFAPNVAVNVAGYVQVYGTLVGSSVLLNGAGVGIHFDEVLSEACAPGGRPDLVLSSGPKNPSFIPTAVPYQGQPLVVAPNPAHDQVILFYHLDTPAIYTVSLVDIKGDVVAAKALGLQPAGSGRAPWDLRKFAAGVYWVVGRADEGQGVQHTAIFKLALLGQ